VLFPTVEYALFFVGAFVGAWALARHHPAHKTFLLAASWAFYAFWDWRFLPVLVGLSLEAALVAQALEQQHTAERTRRALLATGVTAVLLTLALFKYLGFGASALVAALNSLGFSPGSPRLPELALPVGISFFTFHAISLMVDAWRRRIPVKVKVLDALLYVAFFPQLVAGPILRAATFLSALAQPRDPANIDTPLALQRLGFGLFKKVVLAQLLASALVDPVFDAPAEHSSLEVLLGVYGYAAQIFCDFSGYTDMAIGSAALLGYAMPENFDAPYSATSPQDFWRRWHISLSSWLRDYLFIPLGGSRGGAVPTAAALGLTMVLGGLWHGAAWTFVAWGAFHGVGLIIHRAWAASPSLKSLRVSRGWSLLAPVLTFHFVCLGWVLFRAPSLGTAQDVLLAILRGVPGPTPFWVAGLVLLGLLASLVSVQGLTAMRAHFSRLPLVAQGVAFALLVVALDALGPRGVAPFIYFQF
jgi:D-alanyl-lipoteichoic acid acyltransferase DltB (MBOAT superfamily)